MAEYRISRMPYFTLDVCVLYVYVLFMCVQEKKTQEEG